MAVSRLKRLAQNLALMFGALFLCFAALEVILRIAGYGNVEIYEPDAKLYWKLKPNQDCYTKVDRKPVHINSRGTRGREFDIPKPAQTFRILSLGDSRTFGWGLSETESYAGRLETLLQAHLGPKRRVEVINAGINAYSFPQMQVYFRETGLQFQPDMVLIGDANLWTQFSEDNSPEFVRTFMSRVRLKNFLRRFAVYHYVVEYQLRDFYERTRSKFIPIDPKTDTLFKEQQKQDPDAFFRRHIETLCSLAHSNKVQAVLLYLPTLDALNSTNENNVLRAKREVSRHFQVPLIDFTDDLKGRNAALYLEADPVHMNVEGNEIMGRRLFTAITNLMTQ